MKEYWLESTNGQGYFQETKKEFYNAIRAVLILIVLEDAL